MSLQCNICSKNNPFNNPPDIIVMSQIAISEVVDNDNVSKLKTYCRQVTHQGSAMYFYSWKNNDNDNEKLLVPFLKTMTMTFKC